MDKLCHIANTIFGRYQRPFCPRWDEMLNKIMSECEVTDLSEHTITFSTKRGQVCVWCANKWYSFGHLYRVNDKWVGAENERRPRFSTMQRLHRIHSSLWQEKLKTDYSRIMEKISD
ncbi:hypothetical protein [Serratia marcescens]|uniref:Uncharacterized protein n=1 Tax=Serratia marcescens TaxID=615 RepID=A0A9X8VGU3_SERMA|nr:hypothetical protein [Serratia marcescens]MBS3895047.1 hypothetical protein [Serratia marcescens]